MTEWERDPSTSNETATEGRHRMSDTDPYTRTDLITIAVGALVLVGCALLARNELTDVEVSIFQAVNELPQGYHAFVWPFMQYGTFITIPVLALIAFAFRRFRLGWALLLAGTSVYLLALVVKQAVERGRPGWLLKGSRRANGSAPRASGSRRGTRRWQPPSPWWWRCICRNAGRSRRSR